MLSKPMIRWLGDSTIVWLRVVVGYAGQSEMLAVPTAAWGEEVMPWNRLLS